MFSSRRLSGDLYLEQNKIDFTCIIIYEVIIHK